MKIQMTIQPILWFQLLFVVLFLSTAASEDLSFNNKLISYQWYWEKSQYNNDTTLTPQDNEKYLLVFSSKGSLYGTADCNRVRTKYTLQKSMITIEPIVPMKAMCSEKSLSDTFIKDLENVSTVMFAENKLIIELKHHKGIMIFLPVETEKLEPSESALIACSDPRPEVCTMEYNPVCGKKKSELQAVYSNECSACADIEVIGYYKGECLLVK